MKPLDILARWPGTETAEEVIAVIDNKPCLHRQCECRGTGRKKDGSMCVHMISCSCRRCSPAHL